MPMKHELLALNELQSEVLRLTNELAVERARSSAAREEEARQKRLDETARAAFVAMDCNAERAYSLAGDLERVRDAYVGSRQAILKAADHFLTQRAQSATSSASSTRRASSATRGILSWEKPERAMDIAAWKTIAADGAPPGVYTPNMSPEDRRRWKARLVGAKTPSQARVEIRKEWGSLLVIVVHLDAPNVTISQNGKIWGSFEEFAQLVEAVAEAREVLEKLRAA